jgi:CubicO group peptidase (beta-lactamase class C family)
MKRFLIVLTAACTMFTGLATCQTKRYEATAARIRAYLSPFASTGNLTGAVLVARKGEILFDQAFGMANYEWQIPNSLITRFHIASISKVFTAAAILQLQEQGRLQVSDSIARYLPDFPQGDRITLDNLLTHTSGIPDINGLADYDTFARSPHTLEQIVAKFAGLPLEFQPGSKAEYSNSNYNLLAIIIEKVSGESYGDYLNRHIFVPCGLHYTGHDGNSARIIPSAASGYEPFQVAAYEKARYVDWSNKTGNGSLYSTVGDLFRFDRALNSGKVLKAPTRKQYYVAGEENRYGWYFRNRVGHRAMSAKGRSPGFSAELDDFPDDDVTIIVLSNSYSTVSQDPIALGLAAIVFGSDPPKPPTISSALMSESGLAPYAGEYQYGPDYFAPNAKFSLCPQSGFLVLQLGETQSPLVSLGHDEFIERMYFGSIKITRDAQEKVEGLVTRYGDRKFAARRLEPKAGQLFGPPLVPDGALPEMQVSGR